MYFFIVDQQAEFDFNSVGSLTQQCTGRSTAPHYPYLIKS